MTRVGRIRTEATAAARSFLRRRTAVFFTFFFPVILVVIFGALVRTQPTGGGLFAEPAGYYIPGYLAVVVLFTPLSRVGSEIARHRDGGRFEKLATTPLSRVEWLLAHTLVNVAIIGAASLLIFALVLAVTDADPVVSPALAVLPVFVAVGVALEHRGSPDHRPLGEDGVEPLEGRPAAVGVALVGPNLGRLGGVDQHEVGVLPRLDGAFLRDIEHRRGVGRGQVAHPLVSERGVGVGGLREEEGQHRLDARHP